MRWRLKQAEEFRQEVERSTDAERVILADAYQALRRCGATGHFPPLSPRDPPVPDPHAGDAYALVLPTVVVGYQVLGNVIVVPAADPYPAPLRVGSGAWTSAQRDGSRSTHSECSVEEIISNDAAQ